MSSTSAINSLLSSTAVNTTASTTGNSAIDLSSILAAEAGASTPGIDVTAAVNAALYADRAPERIWQSDQTTLSSQTSALTSIQSATEALQSDMQSLNTLTGPLEARTVTSSNSNYVTATAATGTTVGVHNVVVNTLATQGSWYSDLESSPTATLPTSSMTITTTSGATATIATGSGNTGDTLNDLASAINANTSLNLTATVLSDSTGSRLAIVSSSSGTANDFSITSQNFSGPSWTSPDLPSGSSLGANSITITGSGSGAPSITVNTTSGETYSQLASGINSAISSYNAANPSTPLNVTATAGSDSNGTNINIASTDGSSFSINEPALGFTQANAATNASVTIDGVPISSASNTITGAIPGVTLNLEATTQGAPVSLTVAPDESQISSEINQFVTDYNSALNLVNAQFNVTTGTDSSGNATASEGVLASDSSVQSLQSVLEQAVGYVYTPTSGTTTVSTLNDLGITMNNDGTLSVDTTTLDNALTTNPTDVQNFFQGSALNGFANNFYSALNTYTSPADGAFQVDLNSMNSENTELGSEISDFETGYVASQQTTLTADFSEAEEALQQLPEEMQQLNSELGFTNSNQNG
jgi:flagellar hook-associated protein 2